MKNCLDNGVHFNDPIRRERNVPFEVKEICEIYENGLKGTRLELSEKDMESTYNAQMDYTHVVRSTLNVLKKEGLAISEDRNQWKLTDLGRGVIKKRLAKAP